MESRDRVLVEEKKEEHESVDLSTESGDDLKVANQRADHFDPDTDTTTKIPCSHKPHIGK